mgnify:CR=1 FL=1
MHVQGTATVLGDDIDTDVIFPARYLAVLKPEDQAKYLFEPLGEVLQQKVFNGGVVVGGWNFGCGSSREHAVTSMLGANVRLVLAKSFSRIFFRNAVNNGLAVVISPDIASSIADGDKIYADLEKGQVSVNSKTLAFTPLPPEVLAILSAGGLWAAKTKQRSREGTP